MFKFSASLGYFWISVLCSCVLLYSLAHHMRQRHFRPLPPGPKRLPLLGNLHQLPSGSQEHTFKSWAKKYGDLIYAEFIGHRTLIVNSPKVARDLLDKRGGIYSSRPRLVTMVELLGWYPNTVLLPYHSEARRRQRRWIQAAFGEKGAVRKYEGLQRRETCIFLLSLMETPKDFTMHIIRFAAALILESVFGHRITSLEDEYITLMDRAMDATNATAYWFGEVDDQAAFTNVIVKYVPAWMPGADFKRKALYARKLVWDANHIPYDMVRKAVESGNARASYVSELIEGAAKAGHLAEEEDNIRYSAGALYSAGTDTTKTVLRTFFLAMTLHPKVYVKAQEEIDRVVGSNRLPTLEDRPNLPYIDCILKETYRWNTPVPLGLPHYLTEDDQYEGYHIPRNTTVVANLWSMTHDERAYDNPDTFSPERFLETHANEDLKDPRNIVFGYGRRLCPGRLFGDTSLFLAMASVAATLNIGKAQDATGLRESLPDSYPADYECSITPRSTAAISVVAETLASLESS
ncbi:hypothetical protein EVJ58_g998 [Rhodofomes roseus]|uniref:Cytochrome P450 n=1 Tax=Rhodofomes roseus TaxID=34475 RepID=A0A4Y9Z0W7_9APHY|nr:hypothetical protein EVJ58_g998 [Rhodofomes roseus]